MHRLFFVLSPTLIGLYRIDVLANLHELPFAPSVALQQVPKQSISDILAQQSQDAGQDDDDSDLDARIQSMSYMSFHVVLLS